MDFKNIKNDFRCLEIISCLLAGQFPDFMTLRLNISRCLFSFAHWYSKWSEVWSPLPQGQSAFSGILKRWRYTVSRSIEMNIIPHCTAADYWSAKCVVLMLPVQWMSALHWVIFCFEKLLGEHGIGVIRALLILRAASAAAADCTANGRRKHWIQLGRVMSAAGCGSCA
jgi:hypothetical protein